jgi:hypothetical protein
MPNEIVTNNLAQAVQQTPNNKANRDYSKCISLKKALENYEALLRDPKSENKNTGCFLGTKDSDTKKFIEEAQKEIEQCITRGTIDGSVELRGRRANAFALRVPLKDDKGNFSADKFFNGDFCKNSKPKITAVTLYTTKDQIRGLRTSENDSKVRLYEIINGSYTITFNWKAEDKNCSITVSVDSDGKVSYSNPSKDLTASDLEKNTAVNITIGEADKPKKLTLAELVDKDPQRQKISGEVVTINPSTNMANVDSAQHTASKRSAAR